MSEIIGTFIFPGMSSLLSTTPPGTICWRKLSLTNLFGRIKSKKKTGNTTKWVISWGAERGRQVPNLKKECICLPEGDPKTPVSVSGLFAVKGAAEVGSLVRYTKTWVNEECKECIDPDYCPCAPSFSVPLAGLDTDKRRETDHKTTDPTPSDNTTHSGQIAIDLVEKVEDWVEETIRKNSKRNWKCHEFPEL